jgi:hypothetical protein
MAPPVQPLFIALHSRAPAPFAPQKANFSHPSGAKKSNKPQIQHNQQIPLDSFFSADFNAQAPDNSPECAFKVFGIANENGSKPITHAQPH